MIIEQRTDLVDALEKSRQEFQDAVAGVNEEQAGAKPDPARWSVLECVEHVTVVEEIFLSRLETAPRLESPRVDKQREADLAARVPDRTNRAEAPERRSRSASDSPSTALPPTWSRARRVTP